MASTNVTSCISPNKRVSKKKKKKRVSKPLVPLNQDTDWSSLVMKVLDGIFFPHEAVSGTPKICCVGQIPSLVILVDHLGNLEQLPHKHLELHVALL